MLGISFKIPNEYDTILYKILENIDLDKQSICKIKEGEVLNENGACFFKDEIYTECLLLVRFHCVQNTV